MVRSTFRRVLTVAAFALTLGALAFSFMSASSESSLTSTKEIKPSTGTYSAPSGTNKDAEVVTVGLYGLSAYGIDTATNTFKLKGYLWLRWNGDFNPADTLEIANAVDESSFSITRETKEPMELANGDLLQPLRVEGQFFQPFNLGNFPLDRQELSISIEDNYYDADSIVYVADTEDSGIDDLLKIPGWNIQSLTSKPLVHNYNSNFGDPDAPNTEFSVLKFELNIERSHNFFWGKLLFPLLLVLITNWFALILKPRFAEIRTAMPATALLTTVFLQQTTNAAIPEVSTAVLMDYIYLFAYALIVLTFAQVVWDNHRAKEDDHQVTAKVQNFDRLSIAIQFAATCVGLLFVVINFM
jgi:hypothetical protein